MSFYYKQEISIASDPWTQWKFHALMTTHEGGLKVTLVWKKFPKVFYEQDIYIEDPKSDHMWIMEKLITDLKKENWLSCGSADTKVEAKLGNTTVQAKIHAKVEAKPRSSFIAESRRHGENIWDLGWTISTLAEHQSQHLKAMELSASFTEKLFLT